MESMMLSTVIAGDEGVVLWGALPAGPLPDDEAAAA